MMSVSNSFLSTFFTSEGDLITRIMKDFLTIRDFCKFNTSLCNHEHRDNVLRYFEGYSFEGYSFYGNNGLLGDAFLNWARRLHVLVKELDWRIESVLSSSILRETFESYSWDLILFKLFVGDEISAPEDNVSHLLSDFLLVIKNSPRLLILEVQGFVFVTDNVLDSIVPNCTEL